MKIIKSQSCFFIPKLPRSHSHQLNGIIEEMGVIVWGCRKSQNPLTSKVTKEKRKDRKEHNINGLSLRPLRKP
jgi:hypothetical protein